MHISVCVAITPATETRVAIADSGRTIDFTDVKYEIGAYDEFAVEEAIALKEKLGGGEVEIVTVDDGSHQDQIRKCLAIGADKATILKADTTTADSAAVAKALAAHIKNVGSEAVFCGKQSVDGDSSQVPAHIARELSWPVVSKISKLSIDDGSFHAEREIEGGVEVIEGTLPAVFSAEKGLNKVRKPALKGIMAAKKKTIDTVDVTLDAPRVEIESLELPPPRPEGRIVGEGIGAVPELVRLLKDEAKAL